MESDIINLIIGIVGGLAPTSPFLLKFRNKARQLSNLLTEIEKSLDDKKLTNEEISRITRLARGLIN